MWWLLVVIGAFIAWRIFVRKMPSTDSSLSSASEPLHLDLEMQISGAPDQVTGYLHDVAQCLQREIETRKERVRLEMNASAPVSALQFTELLKRASLRIATVFADVERGFAAASARSGQPEAIRAPFALLVEGVVEAMEPFRSVHPPVQFDKASREYTAMLRSIYEQISDWPGQIRDAASAGADTCNLHLTVQYDAARVERAIEDGTA